jgi:hypothetical protein
MGMNIKDPQVHAMARQQALLQLLDRCRQLPWPDGRSNADLQAELYDEAGLPL